METARGNWDFLHVSTILSKGRSAAVLRGALVHSDDSVQGAAHRLSAERSSEWRAEIGKNVPASAARTMTSGATADPRTIGHSRTKLREVIKVVLGPRKV